MSWSRWGEMEIYWPTKYQVSRSHLYQKLNWQSRIKINLQGKKEKAVPGKTQKTEIYFDQSRRLSGKHDILSIYNRLLRLCWQSWNRYISNEYYDSLYYFPWKYCSITVCVISILWDMVSTYVMELEKKQTRFVSI